MNNRLLLGPARGSIGTEISLPAGVANYLPGVGEEIGHRGRDDPWQWLMVVSLVRESKACCSEEQNH